MPTGLFVSTRIGYGRNFSYSVRGQNRISVFLITLQFHPNFYPRNAFSMGRLHSNATEKDARELIVTINGPQKRG